MGRFGDYINKEKIIITFYSDPFSEKTKEHDDIINDVSRTLDDSIEVLKINVDRNEELAMAMRIKTCPTYMVYKKSQMVFRQSGDVTKEQLLEHLQ